MMPRWSSVGGRAYAAAAIVLLLLAAGSAAAAAGLSGSGHNRPLSAARSSHAGPGISPAPSAGPVTHLTRATVSRRAALTGATAAHQLERLVADGEKFSPRTTVQMGEVLGIGAPGSGEMVRIHSAWNTATHVQADAVTLLYGRLSAGLTSQQVASTIDISKNGSTWIKPTVAGTKWTYERLPTATPPAASLLADVLGLTGKHGVTRLSLSKRASKWRISYHASDLQLLEALRGQVPAISKLGARARSLLSGEHLSIPDLQLTLDSHGRVTELQLGGVLRESKADAATRKDRLPHGGDDGVIELRIVYTYGGHIAITPPPARDIINPKKPLR